MSPIPGDPTTGGRRESRDFDAEIAAHVAHRADDLVASGVPRPEAEAMARAELGDLERYKNQSQTIRADARRRAGRQARFDALRGDASFALRQLRRSPAFAASALLTLMLGIGATATIVSVVRAVAFAPLPFEVQWFDSRPESFPAAVPG